MLCFLIKFIISGFSFYFFYADQSIEVMEKHLLPMLVVVLCCWLALCSGRVIKNENKATKDDALALLDKENTKKTTSTRSVTEELARNLMESLYDELRKRTNELNTDSASKRSLAAPPRSRPPGLWGRELGPGLWGREADASSEDRPIPGIWGR